MDNKVYCKNCRHAIINRSEIGGEIVEKKCGKVVEYEHTPFEKIPATMKSKDLNGENACPFYINKWDIFGKDIITKTSQERDKAIMRLARKQHIMVYTFGDNLKELLGIKEG